MLELQCGEIKLFQNLKLLDGQVLKSENAYIASVMQNGKVIGNSEGETDIVIEENHEIVNRFHCKVTCGKSSLPLLLNRFNKVPAPCGELVLLEPHLVPENNEILLEQYTASAFSQMVQAAKKENIWLIANFGYRSNEQQAQIIDHFTSLEGKEKAMQRCAPVGFSEHHSGLSLDVGGGIYKENQQLAAARTVWSWIAENCHKYGFALKNLPGKEKITGTIYEPWHIRYLGDLELCAQLHEKQLTLDEYLDQI